MNAAMRAQIELNHALASALQMLIGFEDRPECYGPVPTLEDQFTQLAASYKVPRDVLVAEYARVTESESFAPGRLDDGGDLDFTA